MKFEIPKFSKIQIEKMLIGLLFLVVVGEVMYFTFFKDDKSPTIFGNNLNPKGMLASSGSEVMPLNQDSVDSVKNASVRLISTKDLDDSSIYMISSDTRFVDGVAPFSYCSLNKIAINKNGGALCEQDNIKIGTLEIVKIIALPDSMFVSTPDLISNGVMVASFATEGGKKEYYLGAFRFYKEYEAIKNLVDLTSFKNLGKIPGTIDKISASTSSKEIVLSIKTFSGKYLDRIFVNVLESENSNTSFVEVTSDGTSKVYSDQWFGYRFIYPQNATVFSGDSLRAFDVETLIGTSTIYHAKSCGVQPTFSDKEINLRQTDSRGNYLNVNISVHKISPSVVYLTNAVYGYDSKDFNQIIGEYVMEEYIHDIRSNTTIPDRRAKLETIYSYPVRHIMPFIALGFCEGRIFEQYQWVAGDLLFSLIFENKSNSPSVLDMKINFLQSIFSSLVIEQMSQ